MKKLFVIFMIAVPANADTTLTGIVPYDNSLICKNAQEILDTVGTIKGKIGYFQIQIAKGSINDGYLSVSVKCEGK